MKEKEQSVKKTLQETKKELLKQKKELNSQIREIKKSINAESSKENKCALKKKAKKTYCWSGRDWLIIDTSRNTSVAIKN